MEKGDQAPLILRNRSGAQDGTAAAAIASAAWGWMTHERSASR